MFRTGSRDVDRLRLTSFRMLYFTIMLSTLLLLPIKSDVLGRVNLPQLTAQVALPDTSHAVLQKYFDSLGDDTTDVLRDDVERILVDALPKDYPAGCQEMIWHWGTAADGTAAFSVRVLFVRDNAENDTRQVLLAYRCFSTYKGYHDQFYDERLAALLIGPTTSSLVLLPHAENREDCADLSRIRLDRVLQSDGVPLVALLIATSDDNPCCGGPFQSSSEWIHYYIFQETSVRLVASVLKHSEEYTHVDPDGDYDIIYDAKITPKKDRRGNVTRIQSQYTLNETGKVQSAGELSYVWNQKAGKFEQR